MEKINGTLYSPVDSSTGERTKMYVETSAEAVVMKDGSTLQENIDNRDMRISISNEQPEYNSLWIKPRNGIDPKTYFNFDDIKADIPENDVPIHILRTPADKDGIRQTLHPLTDSDQVYVNGVDSLDSIFTKYDMGFNISREKPDHRQLWANEIYKSIVIYDTDTGKTDEIILMNDFLLDQTTINGVTHVAPNRIFDLGLGNMVLLNPDSPIIDFGDGSGTKLCEMLPAPNYSDDRIVDIYGFLLNSIVIDGVEVIRPSKIFNIEGDKFAFFNPNKFVLSEEVPQTDDAIMWGDTTIDTSD